MTLVEIQRLLNETESVTEVLEAVDENHEALFQKVMEMARVFKEENQL